MLFVTLYLNFQHNVLTFIMVYARLSIIFYLLPVFGERILSNLILKNSIIALTVIGLWPIVADVTAPEQGWLSIIMKEVIVGTLLAISMCVPFWLAINLGELLDNQRGATISDSIDPVHGVQTSLMSSFLSYAFGAIFFASGGMVKVVDVIVESYRFLPRGSSITAIHWDKVGVLVDVMVKNSILLAAPVMLVMLTTEILLGVFARFCPQLNPFSLSLTMKSTVSFIVFLFYGFQALAIKPLQLFSIDSFRHLIF